MGRQSSTFAASWLLAMCSAVCFTGCKCCTAAVHHCLQYTQPATTRHDHCNVSGRRDHRCLSLPAFFCPCPEACLRIVDVRGIMGRACAKQWGAHVQSNGLRMCKAMACAWRWLYLLANTSAPLKDQSLMLSLSCMDMVSPDKLSRLLLSMKPVQLNNLSASVLVAKTQRYFLASLHRLGNCGLLGLNQSKGSSPSSRAFSERSCLLLLC